LISGLNGSGHASGTTQAAVSEGNITVRDQDKQQHNVADLSRDTANANGSIAPIFDKEKEQKRLKQAQLIGEIGGQAADIIRTQGEINGLNAAKADLAKDGKLPPEPGKNAKQEEIDRYVNILKDTAAYKEAMKQYGTGSDVQKAAQAVTAALQGLAGGNISQALAGGLSPYAAEQIKKYTGTNETANALAHAVWGAIAAQVSGNSAAAGAAGAAGGELAARYLAEKLYGADTPGKIAKLSEEQKQSLSALSTLAAGLAGGVTGDSTANALAGAQAGKNAVENNYLSQGMQNYGQSVASYAQYAQDKNLPPEQVQADLAQMVKGDLPESADIIKAILSNNPGSDTIMALLTAEEVKDYALALLTSIPAEKALSLVGKAAKVIDNKILISAAEKISTAKPGKQFTQPRDLNEQVLWNQIEKNPSSGYPLKGMNTDPRFPSSAGFHKMSTNHTLPDGSNIEIHYQYNAVTNKAYDVKIVTPKRSELQPGPSLKEKP
jgi:filamentous hemagglutinin